MKSLLQRWAGAVGVLSVSVVPAAAACPPLLDHTFPGLLDAKPVHLCQYAGKVILAVNTASHCGFTPQYEGLQKLYARLKDRGFVIIGFPSNEFGGQEPGSDQEIASFCQMNYGVDFPMVGKTAVTGEDANPFFKQLVKASGTRPKWNFYKYLINREATEVIAFSSLTKPDSRSLQKKIDELLR